MKNCLKILLFVMLPFLVSAQQKEIDSFRNIVLTSRADTAKINPLLNLCQLFLETTPDSTVILARQALLLSRQNALAGYEVESLYYLSVSLAFDPKKNDSV